MDAAAGEIKLLFFIFLPAALLPTQVEDGDVQMRDEFCLNERHAAVKPVIKKVAAAGTFWYLLLFACPSCNEKLFFFF